MSSLWYINHGLYGPWFKSFHMMLNSVSFTKIQLPAVFPAQLDLNWGVPATACSDSSVRIHLSHFEPCLVSLPWRISPLNWLFLSDFICITIFKSTYTRLAVLFPFEYTRHLRYFKEIRRKPFLASEFQNTSLRTLKPTSVLTQDPSFQYSLFGAHIEAY